MSFQKISNDRWYSSPPTFTTSLKAKVGSITAGSTISLTSELCGFGWRYQVEFMGTGAKKQDHMAIFLDPFLLSCAAVGTIRLVTRYRNVGSPGWTTYGSQTTQIRTNMPDKLTQIAYFDLKLRNYLDGIIIEVALHLQDAFSLLDYVESSGSNVQLSKLPTADIIEAVSGTIDGEELADTRLDLFTSLSMDKRLVGPKSLFVNSRLLFGRCGSETLDTCEYYCAIQFLLYLHLTSPGKVLHPPAGFKESSSEIDLDTSKPETSSCSEEYDYLSDSDLDPDESRGSCLDTEDAFDENPPHTCAGDSRDASEVNEKEIFTQ
jgi:hypothetical protein